MKKSGVFQPYPQAEFLPLEYAELSPVYNSLDKDEQAVYTALYDGIIRKKTKVPLPYEVSGELYSKIYCLFEKQEGNLFYIDSTYYTAEKIRNARIVFRENTDFIGSKITEFENITDDILSNAPSGEYEKALYIHDYITENCLYDTGDNLKYSSTAYGCLVEGMANCEGYAKAFCYLARKLGLKCVLVTGKTDKGENHAWNQVQIDKEWYNLDVTWDDMDTAEEARKVYFLCNDEDFKRTHIAENTYFTPFECYSQKNNYYVKNGLFACNNSDADLIIRREVDSGKHVIELKFSDYKAYYDFKHDYVDGQKMFDTILDSGYSPSGQMTVTLRENEDERCITLNFS